MRLSEYVDREMVYVKGMLDRDRILSSNNVKCGELSIR